MDWNRFAPVNFEYDWENDKLGEHGVSFGEAWKLFSIIMKSEGTKGLVIDINSLAGQMGVGN